MPPQPNSWLPIAIGAAVAMVVLYFRSRRLVTPRPLTPGRLWIVPVLMAAIFASTLYQHPPAGLDWVWLVLVLVVGGVLGWHRGKLIRIWRDPESGQVMAQGSILAVIFLVALVLIRFALRAGLAYEGAAVDAALFGNLFIAFAVGLFGVQRAEMALRAKRLEDSAR
ncbi:MAG: DUF1453 family protein [Sphingomonadales bacterium]|nr:DUF1453 family protein [Sphingomonadales bacterium]MBD3773979.1 DUF1453 family protein [Paracoccaceae bacterium]